MTRNGLILKVELGQTDPLTSAQAANLRYVTGEGPGIVRKRRGKGFDYLGPDAKLVRDKSTLERIRALVIPPGWEHVWICPTANGHIQAIGRDAKGRKQYRYHARYPARSYSNINRTGAKQLAQQLAALGPGGSEQETKRNIGGGCKRNR